MKKLAVVIFGLLMAGCGLYERVPEFDGCQPISECGVDRCGEIDDGCGGILTCEPCDCIDGSAKQEFCGGCALGLMQCAPAETGVGLCVLPDIPGWDGESCDGLVFVSPDGNSAGTGEKSAPFDSIVDGIVAAKAKGAVGVIVAGGAGDIYEGRLVIDSPVSVVGGYTNQFTKDISKRPVVISDEDEGLLIKSVATDILVKRIEVKVSDSKTPGASNYAVRIFDSRAVTLRDVSGQAGKGGDGVSGAAGGNGENGSAGESLGVLIREQRSAGGTSEMFAAPNAKGGMNEACIEANGGSGGSSYLSLDSPEAAKPGADGHSTTGGAAGVFLPGKNELRPGEDGESGKPTQVNAKNGDSGDRHGKVRESTGEWIPGAAGESGQDGENGSGGGGGGGGVGHDNNYELVYVGGSNGGGGGAGGCGGQGGGGGSNGGGSFGLFAAYSGLVLDNSTFSANTGGAGGSGGTGGHRGLGGAGGTPHLKYQGGSGEQTFLITGGRGGDGAPGGNGGAGGGGAGGPSFGGYCYRTQTTLNGANRFVSGDASQGGASAGVAGPAGEVVDSFQCD